MMSEEQKKSSKYLGDGVYYRIDDIDNVTLWTERHEQGRVETHYVVLEPEHVSALYKLLNRHLTDKFAVDG